MSLELGGASHRVIPWSHGASLVNPESVDFLVSREATLSLFRPQDLAVHDDFKCATGARYQFELSVHFCRQRIPHTEGAWFVASTGAVFNRDVFHFGTL